MAIQTPIDGTRATSKSKRFALEGDDSFVQVGTFVFRIGDVDGFLHAAAIDADHPGITTVYFKSYHAAVPDSGQQLFQFLKERVNPNTHRP